MRYFKRLLVILIPVCFLINNVKGQGLADKYQSKVNGQVFSMQVDEEKGVIYLGGHFNRAGNLASFGAHLSNDAKVLNQENQPNGRVEDVHPDGKGGYYLAGSFTEVGGEARYGLAHIDANGDLTSWGAQYKWDRGINAIYKDGDRVYIGGFFTAHYKILGSRGFILGLDNDQPAQDAPLINEKVFATISDESGGFFLGGQFTKIGDEYRNGLAYLKTDGTLSAWQPLVKGTVYGMAISGTTLYFGGDFDEVNNEPRSNLAAVDIVTGELLPWNPEVDDAITSLAIIENAVYIAGGFSQVNGESRYALGAVDIENGATTSWAPQPSGRVEFLSSHENLLYISGAFENIMDTDRDYFAVYDHDSQGLTDWDPQVNSIVRTVEFFGDKVYLGGDFTQVAGEDQNFLAALDVNTAELYDWNPAVSGDKGRVNSMVFSGNEVFIGGRFTEVGGLGRNYAAAVDLTTGEASAWNPDLSGTVNRVSKVGNTVFLGGSFNGIGVEKRNYIAALDANTGELTDWAPEVSNSVDDIVVHNGNVYIAGKFYNVGGEVREHLASLNATTGEVTDWAPNTDYWVNVLHLKDNSLYVGGWFRQIGGQGREGVAKFDLTDGALSDWDPDLDSYTSRVEVHTITSLGDNIYLGGGFRKGSFYSLVAVNEDTAIPTSWGPAEQDFPIEVSALAIKGDTVFISGDFDSIGGEERNDIAAIDINTGEALAWSPTSASSMSYEVNSMLPLPNGVYLGGAFTAIGGVERRSLASLDLETGELTDWAPVIEGTFGAVYETRLDNNLLYLVGNFEGLEGIPRNNSAAINTNTGEVTDWNPDSNAETSFIGEIEVTDELVYLGGNFLQIGGLERNNVAAVDKELGAVSDWAPVVNDGVGEIEVVNDTIYLGGVFTEVSGLERNHLAAVKAGSGEVLDWNPGADGTISRMKLVNNLLYLSGNFNTVGGEDRPLLTNVDRKTGEVGDWNPALHAPGGSRFVGNFEVSGNVLYITGYFSRVNDQWQNSLAAFNLSSGELLDWNPLESLHVTRPVALYNGVLFGGLTGQGLTNSLFVVQLPAGLQKVDFTPLESKVYGDTPFEADIAASSEVTVSLESSDETVATVSGNTITIVGAGTTIIKATPSGGFNGVQTTSQSLVVNKAALEIRADDKERTYGDEDPDLTLSYLGFVNEDDPAAISPPEISSDATITSGVGTYDIVLSGGSGENYELSLINGTLTITKASLEIKADDKERVYGDEDPDFTLSYLGFVNGDDPAAISPPDISSSSAITSGVGTYDIALSGGSGENYELSLINGTLIITKASLEIKADDKERVYGDEDPDFTLSYLGFVNGDDPATISPPEISSSTTATSGVGTYDIVLSGGTSENYELSLIDGMLTITKASLIATPENTNKNKGEANPEFTIIYEGFKNSETSVVLDTPPMASTDATVESNRGTYDIILTGGEDDNYSFDLRTGTLTITGPVFTLPETVDFGEVGKDDVSVETISIDNSGDGALNILSVSMPQGFDIDQTTLNVMAGEMANLSISFLPTEATNYSGNMIIESNDGDYEITLSGEGVLVTGIDNKDFRANQISIFPNPVKNIFSIGLGNLAHSKAALSLLDAKGTTSWALDTIGREQVQVDVSRFESGVYFLRVSTSEGIVIKRVLIEH